MPGGGGGMGVPAHSWCGQGCLPPRGGWANTWQRPAGRGRQVAARGRALRALTPPAPACPGASETGPRRRRGSRRPGRALSGTARRVPECAGEPARARTHTHTQGSAGGDSHMRNAGASAGPGSPPPPGGRGEPAGRPGPRHERARISGERRGGAGRGRGGGRRRRRGEADGTPKQGGGRVGRRADRADAARGSRRAPTGPGRARLGLEGPDADVGGVRLGLAEDLDVAARALLLRRRRRRQGAARVSRARGRTSGMGPAPRREREREGERNGEGVSEREREDFRYASDARGPARGGGRGGAWGGGERERCLSRGARAGSPSALSLSFSLLPSLSL